MARVNIVYHHFPHYRAPVMRALIREGRHEYRFWGDVRDHQGIKAFPGDEQVEIHPVSFVFDDETGYVDIKKYWPAVFDRTADVLIIIGNIHMRSTWIMALAGRLIGKKVLFWAHGWRRKEPWLRARIRNFYYGLAHAVLVYAERAKVLARESGFDPARVLVIYNSLDHENMRAAAAKAQEFTREELQKKHDLPAGKRILFCAARLNAQSQFRLLLEALSIIGKTSDDYCAVLVGDGPEKENLLKLAGDLGVAVIFKGEIYDELTLAELYRAVDVTVSPGKVGLTAMQSLSHGVPVITHGDMDRQMPEVEAVVSMKTGAFFDYGDAHSLARAVQSWFANSPDERAVGDACREVISRKYNPSTQVTLIDQAIDNVLQTQI